MTPSEVKRKYGDEIGDLFFIAEYAVIQMCVASQTLDVDSAFDRVREKLSDAIDALRDMEAK